MQRDLLVGDLGATFVAPDASKHAALILQGSGVHDRNGAMPAFNFRSNLYERLARELAARGIATLRYDKRGHDLPANAPRDYSFTSRVEDARAALMVLVSQPEVAGDVAIVGHSEGALIAACLGGENRATRVVSLAAPFANVFELSRFRAAKLANGPNTHLHLRGQRALHFYALLDEAFRADRKMTPHEFRAFAEPFLDAGFAGWESYDWLREHFDSKSECDPTERGVSMLVIQGGRDARLWDDNIERWQRWCSTRPLAKVVEIPDMGHDLNDARRKAFVLHESLVPEIAKWLGL